LCVLRVFIFVTKRHFSVCIDDQGEAGGDEGKVGDKNLLAEWKVTCVRSQLML
jgi:hypothetical protein